MANQYENDQEQHDRMVGDPPGTPLSGKILHAPLDGVPWGDREVGPGWEDVEDPDVTSTR